MSGTRMRDGIVKRGSRWAYKLELPRDPGTGKRRQQWVSGFPTRKAAEADRDEARARVRRGTYVVPTRQTVGEYLSEWLDGVRGEYMPGSYDAVKLHVERYISPRIGQVPLAGLTTPTVKAFYAELYKSGRLRSDKPLSAKTVHNIHRTLSRALNDAVQEQPPRIPANPAARAHKAPASPEQATWTAEDLHRFYAFVGEDRLFALWRLAASTGLRRGELVGLRWSDVDLDAARISIASQRSKGGGTVATSRPKNKRGRVVELDPVTVSALRSYRTRQLEERMMLGDGWHDSGLVFTHADGTPLHPDSVTKRFGRLVLAAELPTVKLHGLRHTHATLMLGAGVHIKIVQERLGHSSIAITGDVYSHVSASMQADAAAAVAAMVDSQPRVANG